MFSQHFKINYLHPSKYQNAFWLGVFKNGDFCKIFYCCLYAWLRLSQALMEKKNVETLEEK